MVTSKAAKKQDIRTKQKVDERTALAELLGKKDAKEIPADYMTAIADKGDRVKLANLAADLANYREARKQLEDEEKTAKESVIGLQEKYGFSALHVEGAKLSVKEQSRDYLDKERLVHYLLGEKGWTVDEIRECLDAGTKTSTFKVVSVGPIPKNEQVD